VKIVKVATKRIETKMFPDRSRSQVIVKITTDEGLSGVGEAWAGGPPAPVESAVNDALAPQILGENSGNIEFLWHKMYQFAYRYGTEGVILCAISGIDIALWDLMGKRYDVPVAQLLGGTVREGVKAYASLPHLGKARLVKEEIKKVLEAGFIGIKLHEKEIEVVAAARAALPEGFPIMLDVAGHWTVVEAEDQARQLEGYDITWIEEPVFPMQNHAAMARARQKTSIRFAAGENEYTLGGFHRLMESGSVDYVQPEISKIGGLTTARKVSVLAELLDFPICPHCYLIGPSLYASIHWAFSQTKMDWHEIKWLPAGYRHSSFPVPRMINGYVQLPDGPGLGIALE